MENKAVLERKAIWPLAFASAVLLLATACAPPARVSLPTEPLPEKAEVVVPKESQSAINTALPPTTALETPSEPTTPPQVMVKERFILPDQQMYAARFRQYEELKKKYNELLFHLEWLSAEEASPSLRQCVADISRIIDGYGQALNEEGQAVNNEDQALNEEGQAVNNEDQALNEEGQEVNNEGQALNEEGQAVSNEDQALNEEGQAVNNEDQTLNEEGQDETQKAKDGTKPVVANKPWQVVWQDLAFLQGQCPALYEAKVREIAGHLKRYKNETATQAGELVSSYAEQKNDLKAIESFKYLTENFPEWQRDPAILQQYGEVLLRQGKLREASAIFSELPQDPASVKQALALYRKSADLLLTVGKLNEAARQFHALKEIEKAAASEDEITDASLDLLERQKNREPLLSIYQNFLWEYYSYDGKNLTAKANNSFAQLKSYFPENPLTENAKRLYAGMVKNTHSVVEEQLATASRLAGEQKFDQAKEVLATIRTDGLSADLKEKIRSAIQEISFNEQEEKKSSAWEQEQRLEQLWQQASQDFDQHKFDEVIKSYYAFVGTKYEQQASDLAAKAVEQAAVNLRKQAASLYLKARKERDVNQRSGYLQESLALLREVESKYPQATIMEKVKRNIAVLEKEIQGLEINGATSYSN